MTKKQIKEAAKQAAAEIYENLCDRRGIGDEIEGCDREIRAEIRTTMREIIEKNFGDLS